VVEKTLDRIEQHLTRLVKISALNLGRGLTMGEQIVLLSKAGFKPMEIADILGTSSGAVRVRLVEARKRGEIK